MYRQNNMASIKPNDDNNRFHQPSQLSNQQQQIAQKLQEDYMRAQHAAEQAKKKYIQFMSEIKDKDYVQNHNQQEKFTAGNDSVSKFTADNDSVSKFNPHHRQDQKFVANRGRSRRNVQTDILSRDLITQPEVTSANFNFEESNNEFMPFNKSSFSDNFQSINSSSQPQSRNPLPNDKRAQISFMDRMRPQAMLSQESMLSRPDINLRRTQRSINKDDATNKDNSSFLQKQLMDKPKQFFQTDSRYLFNVDQPKESECTNCDLIRN